jgi:polysaccharide export outer membrane protein
VAGLTPHELEGKIVRHLKDKANNPQVQVRISHNNTAIVTVIGEVAASALIPLTPRGEKLLDVLASVGGVRQPIKEITIQLTRGTQTQALALETVISDPKQNVVLQPGDVITAIQQPLSITVSGATGKNQELGYETKGITLAQALGRSGGLNEANSDARAVFIFRFEDSNALSWATPPKVTTDGKVPVIYQVNMTDPTSLFVMQNFPMADKDVLYVSNAPVVQMQKFITMLFQSVYMVKTFVPSIP